MNVLKTAIVLAFAGFSFYSTAADFAVRRIAIAGAGTALNAADISAKELYNQNCARCHGADGSGKEKHDHLPSPPDLSSEKFQKKHSDAKIARKIAKGGGGMPGFAGKLSQSEIDSLVGYVRSLKK